MMEIGSEKWLRLIQDGAAQLGVTVHRRQAEQFSRHARWLLEWNRKINLTAITDPREVAIKHFLDAIAPLAHIPDDGPLLDIGTGGGFPGIPLKIMRPGQTMTLVDSVRKKTNFVRHVIRQMPLEGIDVLHARAETLCNGSSGHDKFKVIVCRALADPRSALELAGPLLAPNARIVLYQGPAATADASSKSNHHFYDDPSKYRLDTITYRLPFSDIERSIILLNCRH